MESKNVFYRNNIWESYLVWGMAFATLLSLIDYSHDGFAHVILLLAFICYTGVLENFIVFVQFIRRHSIFIVAIVLWIIYFNKRITSPISNRMPWMVLFVVFGGYRIVQLGKEALSRALSLITFFLGCTVVLGFFWKLSGNNPILPYFSAANAYYQDYWNRMSSIYMQPVPAGCIFLCFTLLCFLFVKNIYWRIGGTVIGFIALWSSSTRSAFLLACFLLLLYLFVNKDSLIKKQNDSPNISRTDRVVVVGCVTLLLIIAYIFKGNIIDTAQLFVYRMQTFNTSEAGIFYRILAWKKTILDYPNGSIVELIMGRGVLQSYCMLASPEGLLQLYEHAGPVENTFINILYDFGLMGFGIYVYMTISAIISIFRSKDIYIRNVAIILIALIGMSATYDLEYWLNTAFLIFSISGVYLGIKDLAWSEQKSLGLKQKKQLKIAVFGHKNAMTNEGGVEVVARELASRLSYKGEDVVCYNRKGHHVSGKEFDTPVVDEYKGFEMKYVPTIEKKGFAALTSSFGAAVAAACGDYDVVHVHAEGPAFFCWIPKLTGKRVICQIHGLDHQRVKWGKVAKQLILWGEENAVKYADEVLVLSRSVQKYFKDTYGRDTVYVPNAVNEPSIVDANVIFDKWGLNKDSYILFLGRMVPEKGIEYLIRAYKEIDTEKKLVIAGGSSDTQKFVNEMKELAKDDERIIFTGFVEGQERAELYSNAYVYVLPSDIEGMPLSLLEAMSYGNCCLVSDIDECTEVVEDKAVTFRHGDKESLQEELAKLLGDDKLVGIYKSSAKEFVCDKYNWDYIVENVEKIYRGSLEE